MCCDMFLDKLSRCLLCELFSGSQPPPGRAHLPPPLPPPPPPLSDILLASPLVRGYYQPAGPLISHQGSGGSVGGGGGGGASGGRKPSPEPPESSTYRGPPYQYPPPPPPPYGSPYQYGPPYHQECYPSYYQHKYPAGYPGRRYGYYAAQEGPTFQPPPSQMETYQPIDPYANYYPYTAPPPPPAPPCYSHSPPTRSIPFMDPSYQSCPCPMQSCPKNVHTGPLTGASKGSKHTSTGAVAKPAVALALPLEPSGAVGPPSPARGSAGMPPPPSPAPATARNPSPTALPVGSHPQEEPPRKRPRSDSSPEERLEEERLKPCQELILNTRPQHRKKDKKRERSAEAENVEPYAKRKRALLKCETPKRPQAKKKEDRPPDLEDGTRRLSVIDEVDTKIPVLEDKLRKPLSVEEECLADDKSRKPSPVDEKLKKVSTEKKRVPVVVEDKPKKGNVEEKKKAPVVEEKLKKALLGEEKTKKVLLTEEKPKKPSLSEEKSRTPVSIEEKPKKLSLSAEKPGKPVSNEDKTEKTPKKAVEEKTKKVLSNEGKTKKAQAVEDKSKKGLAEEKVKKVSVAEEKSKKVPVTEEKAKKVTFVNDEKVKKNQPSAEKAKKVIEEKPKKCSPSETKKKPQKSKGKGVKQNGIRVKKEPIQKNCKSIKLENGKNNCSMKKLLIEEPEEVVCLSPKSSHPTLKWSNGWSWEGEPFKAKVFLTSDDNPESRRCYPAMRHIEGDIIYPRDCVLLRSGARKQQLPFVAKIAAMWENPDDGEMMFSLLWYYRPEHTEQGRQAGQPPDEIFASRHKDTNSVACIEDKCFVLTFNEYCRYRKLVRGLEQGVGAMPQPVPHLEICYPRLTRLPQTQVAPDIVFFCRKVYDFRQRRILKNPQSC